MLEEISLLIAEVHSSWPSSAAKAMIDPSTDPTNTFPLATAGPAVSTSANVMRQLISPSTRFI